MNVAFVSALPSRPLLSQPPATASQHQPRAATSHLHIAGDELGGRLGVDCVAQMRGEDDGQPVADQVRVEAVGVLFGGRDVLQGLAVVWVAEENDRRDLCGRRS